MELTKFTQQEVCIMDSNVNLIGVRVARLPVFFPAKDGNARHNCCLVTVLGNVGKGDNQKTKAYELAFWGKYAEVAAWEFDKGREINITKGELDSYRHDTGRLKANGSKEIYLQNKIHVRKFTFGRDSKKELVERISRNMAALCAELGIQLPAGFTAERLLAITRAPRVDYNPAIHDAAGKYGNATIWRPNMTAAPATASAAPVTADSVAEMEKNIAAMKAQLAAGGTPFPVAG
jgi:hypothetical protein